MHAGAPACQAGCLLLGAAGCLLCLLPGAALRLQIWLSARRLPCPPAVPLAPACFTGTSCPPFEPMCPCVNVPLASLQSAPQARVPLDRILGLQSFDLEKILAMDPAFLRVRAPEQAEVLLPTDGCVQRGWWPAGWVGGMPLPAVQRRRTADAPSLVVTLPAPGGGRVTPRAPPPPPPRARARARSRARAR